MNIEWNTALPATISALVFAFCDAYTVTWLPGDLVRKLLPFVLLVLLVYTWRSSQLGLSHAPIHFGRTERWWAAVVALPLVFMMAFSGLKPGAS